MLTIPVPESACYLEKKRLLCSGCIWLFFFFNALFIIYFSLAYVYRAFERGWFA